MVASKSWLEIPADSHFSIANIPFGIISTEGQEQKRSAVAIGDYALDLQSFAKNGGFSGLLSIQDKLSVFGEPTLNAFAALGRPVHKQVREYLQDVFAEGSSSSKVLKDNEGLKKEALIPRSKAKLHLPMQIGDYTDFFAGINHAFNVGTMFRGPANALQKNYTHLPVGYHGRASSVVVSGTPIRRPNGQVILDPSKPDEPTYTSCKRLDIELELAAFVCTPNKQGEPIPVGTAEDNLFGLVLMNDWSARDIQTWEYVPLGPFNAKNFGTSISPWVVLMDALEPFRTKALENSTELTAYLKDPRADRAYDIKLEVDLTTSDGTNTTISKTTAANLLWSFPQMLAHHTVGGCPMNTGDLLGSGTISGTERDTLGSLLEINRAGKEEVKLSNGDVRKFLVDGDTVTIRGACGGETGQLVGFGECVGTILPAPTLQQ
ncbi:hypothetical protein V494_02595 [Pseudogymnoascus sp. VKM F-4513 (FW-928)]|nr:hypothetical protein V494_02595 [Pseudogymnoascus sp. VKM F-4513 (FW-928)]